MKDALHGMKKTRCERMNEMHECARKVDCLDYLIRNTQKQLQYGEFQVEGIIQDLLIPMTVGM